MVNPDTSKLEGLEDGVYIVDPFNYFALEKPCNHVGVKFLHIT